MPPLASSSSSDSSNSLLSVSSGSSSSELRCWLEERAFLLLSAACFLAILVPLVNRESICAAEEEVVLFLMEESEDADSEPPVIHGKRVEVLLCVFNHAWLSLPESPSSLSFVASELSSFSDSLTLSRRFREVFFLSSLRDFSFLLVFLGFFSSISAELKQVLSAERKKENHERDWASARDPVSTVSWGSCSHQSRRTFAERAEHLPPSSHVPAAPFATPVTQRSTLRRKRTFKHRQENVHLKGFDELQTKQADDESNIYLLVLVRKLFLQFSNHGFPHLPAWSTVFIIVVVVSLLAKKRSKDNMNRGNSFSSFR